MIPEMAEELGVDCIFAHSDEAIYCKMVLIQWLNETKYDKVVNLIGGFHTLMVKLKIMYKKYGALGLREWWVDAGVIAEGSSVQAIEGKHYFRSLRLHKQSFEALLRYRLNNQVNMDQLGDSFKECISTLRKEPNPENLRSLMEQKEFQVLRKELLATTGTESLMIVEYLKDVSCLLALISSVREKSIERHMQAERALLPQLFAFKHVNYARYLTYQHVTLSCLHDTNPTAWQELKDYGFGGSLSGDPFSTVQWDYITETTVNREVKTKAGPMHGGYSTSLQATDTFIKTSHLMAKVRAALKEKLHILTSSTHKEVSPGAKKTHEDSIRKLVEQMGKFLDPFADGTARHFKTGIVVDPDVVKGLLESTRVGEDLYRQFVDERLTRTDETRVSFFKPISSPKIKTGLEKPKQESRVVNMLKEEKQAFGSLVGKITSAEEAHSHPLTSVPLALASPEKDLRQGSKASFRNFLISESDAITDESPVRAEWVIDGMGAVRSVTPRNAWAEYAEAYLKFCIPPQTNNPAKLT